MLAVHYPFGGDTATQMNAIWEAYEAHNTDVGIEATLAENDLSTNQNLFAAVAAGTPPDVTWVDGPQVAEWAVRGVLTDVSAQVDDAALTEADFWTPSWQQTLYAGKIWALTYTADANFGFFWNHELLAAAGWDSAQPPATVDALTELHQELAQGEPAERVGIVPWATYGTANAMFTWGWIFGGAFFDGESNTVTADDERNVMALQWMSDMAAVAGGYDAMIALEAGGNPFFERRAATALLGPWELPNLERAAPDLEYGITFAPAGPPPALPHSSWVGGWCVGIPNGAAHPDAAWDFIHWLCATDEGTALFGELFNQTPGYKKSPWYAILEAEQPQMQPFLEILRAARHQRPVMPAQAFYMGALQRNVDAALRGEASPEMALRTASAETQTELNRILEQGFGAG